MTIFSVSSSVSKSVIKKETKFIKEITTDKMLGTDLTPNDFKYVQLLYRDSKWLGLFKASNDSRFIDNALFWGIIGDEFNDLQ